MPRNLLLLLHALVGTALVAASATRLINISSARPTRSCRVRPIALPAGRLGGSRRGLVRLDHGRGRRLLFGDRRQSIDRLPGPVELAVVCRRLHAAEASSPRRIPRLAPSPVRLPVLMGWTAAGRPLDMNAATLFMIVFLWQFPHFMAIAWLYRRDYAAAGMRMLTVVDPTGLRAGRQAILAASVLVPVTLVPVLVNYATPLYGLAAMVIGLAQLACAASFFRRLDETSARRLLRATCCICPPSWVC